MNPADLPLWASVPAAIALIAGGAFALIGSLGLLRLPGFFARMHGPSMGNTLGAGCVLIASMLLGSALAQRPVVHEILIAVFMIMTSPVTAMLLAQAALYRKRTNARRRDEGETH